ncbi:MAG: metal ABC transporter permease [Candidatus Promineifilaceae bacterium]
MTIEQVEIQLIASVVAAACALPGVFLILRRTAMMSDAISHTVLLGIVGGYFIVGTLDHPLLIVGAAVVGVLTVSLVELLTKTKLVKADAAIGLVFPALFSIAVIMISSGARDVHLDEHVVFQGDLVFAPFDRMILFGADVGPRTLVIMSGVLLVNIVLIAIFYKELKLSTFDASLAAAFGFSPAILHYGLMTMVSVTAVGAFDAVGSILVIAFMIVPPVTAYMLTDRLSRLLMISVVVGIAGSIGGYWMARAFDTTIGGTIVTMLGIIFLLVLMLSPERGFVALARRRARQKWEFASTMLAIHLMNHEGQPDYADEARVEHLSEHMRWEHDFAAQVVRRAQRSGVLIRRDNTLFLTDQGRTRAAEALSR